MVNNDRLNMRQYFYNAWQKFNEHLPLDEHEKQIVDVLINHPEYQYVLDNPDRYLDKDFNAAVDEINPFMHFTLHMTLLDLLKNNEPAGICNVYSEIRNKLADAHQADHYFMELLSYEMHDAFQNHRALDMNKVVENAKSFLESGNTPF